MLDPAKMSFDEWHALCVAHGWDEGNRAMKRRGGAVWSREDYDKAGDAVNAMLALHPKGKEMLFHG